MKLFSLASVLVLAGSSLAMAQQESDFPVLMKATDQAMSALRKAEKKTGPQAVAAAERLGGIYENMINFWRQRGSSEGLKTSIAGKNAAAMLAAAAYSGNEAKAMEAFQGLGSTCKPCHEAHRVRTPEGTFRFRQPSDPTKPRQ